MESFFDNFPVLKLSNGVFLRKISAETDHLNFFSYMSRPEVRAYLAPEDAPTDPLTARVELDYWARLHERRVSIYWAIATEKDNKIIGTCGFNYWNKSQKRAEISYDLDYNFWGRGITTEAIGKIIKFAKDEMKLQRIQATVALDNVPSIKVLEKNSFQKEGILKNYGVLEEKTKDFYMYAFYS